MRWIGMSCSLMLLVLSASLAPAGNGNRLSYLDGPCDPYYVGRNTAKLVTPQWVGEPGVQAVIVLSTDDLREIPTHENYLRPILDRLKKIDGRAPVSLMTNRIDPKNPHLQKWLEEGLSLEAHTRDHPCPLLQGGNLLGAKDTFDANVDLLATVPNSRPVAFRMPCCDSMSSVSPRFFTEILGKTTPGGNFLAIDSSVFHLFTASDAELPRELVLEENGQERFRKYVPTDRIMANLIEDYPYPYVIDHLCWEIPTLMPSDWDAQHLNGVCSPRTVADLKAAVDATVVKQGIFALCFHTHGWIRNDQIVEVIDHAVARHGRKVKFLTFREVDGRLTKNLLGGQSLRAAGGQDNGVRVLDVNNDGYMDALVGNDRARHTRVWLPREAKWFHVELPVQLVTTDNQGDRHEAGVRFGVFSSDEQAYILVRDEKQSGSWLFDDLQWKSDPWAREAFELKDPVSTARAGKDQGWRLRDLDGDGVCEAVVGHPGRQSVFSCLGKKRWTRLPINLPEATALVDRQGRDAGLRLVDFDEDGRLDVVFSNAERYSVHLFTSIKDGWSRCVLSGKRGDGDPNELPPFVRADGTNNGAWFKHRHLWVQNEDTGGKLPGHVFGRHFTQILDADHEPPARRP